MGARRKFRSRPTNRSSVIPSPLPPWDAPDICYKSLLFSTSLQSIGCDDYLGSDKVVDKCGVCGGDNTGCQVVSGVFKHALTSLGYHRVVEIPQGATKINITEMYKSNNYLGKLDLFPEETSCPYKMIYAFQDCDTAVSRGPWTCTRCHWGMPKHYLASPWNDVEKVKKSFLRGNV